MRPIRSSLGNAGKAGRLLLALALVLVLLVAGAAWLLGGGGAASGGASGGGGTTPAHAAAGLAPRAREFGLTGWQRGIYEDFGGDDEPEDVRFRVEPQSDEAALARAAEAVPELTFVRSETDGVGLWGAATPDQTDAIAAIMSTARISAEGIADIPPERDLRSLWRLMAAAVALMAVEPDGSKLISSDAGRPDARRRLEAAARKWQRGSRVSRVVAVPSNGEPPSHRPRMSVRLRSEPDEVENLRELRAVGLYPFPTLDGKILHVHLTAVYQNPDGGERRLTVELAYERETRQWALAKISTMPSHLFMLRAAREGNTSLQGGAPERLELLEVLPECLIMSRDGLVCGDDNG